MTSVLDFCAALSDETRQGILELLLERGEVSVGEIVSAFELSQPAVSHHLKVLKSYGLVSARRLGKQVLYSVRHENVESCCGMICAKFTPDLRLVSSTGASPEPLEAGG